METELPKEVSEKLNFLDALKCKKCDFLLHEPYFLECEHRFCKKCLSKLNKCPECKIAFSKKKDNKEFFDKVVNQVIHNTLMNDKFCEVIYLNFLGGNQTFKKTQELLVKREQERLEADDDQKNDDENINDLFFDDSFWKIPKLGQIIN